MRGLFAAWVLPAAAFIEFYARRYEYAGAQLLPYGALAIVALALVFLPRRAFARLPLPREAARAAAVAIVCIAALVFAALRPLQLVHVLAVAALLAAALAALSPALLRPGPPRYARALGAAVLAALSFALLVYYAVLVIGLEMWNEIVTRQLIWTYARQVRELVAALPIEPWVPWGASAALLALLFAAYWLALPGVARDLREFARRAGAVLKPSGPDRRVRWAGLVLVPVATALLANPVFEVVANGKKPDPLVATFLGEPRTRGTPKMPFRPDPALDELERSAAARYAPPSRIDARPLVLIIVDALRADQMSVYGHPRETTPFLDRLHREGRLTRFDNAFSACTESLCGILAVLNSRYWHELSTGRQRFGLADVLKRLGYRNHFVLGGDHTNFYDLRAYYGNNVDTYFDGTMAAGYMNDDLELIEWLRRLELPRDAPHFLYIHLKSVHMIGKRDPRHRLWYRQPPDPGREARCCSAQQNYTNNYHHGVRQMDALVEMIFAILEAKGLLSDALVAITADHGEMLGEFGARLGHGGAPLDPAVRVPLLIHDARAFDYAPRALTSVVDIAPTLLARIGAPVPDHWSGIALTQPAPDRVVFTQSRDEFAAVGEFEGRLYKYYVHRGADGESDRLVHMPGPARELAVSAAGSNAKILRDLRAALPARFRPHRAGH